MQKDADIWQIEGKIFNYDRQNNLVAFTNNIQSNNIVIFIAGLGDTLLSVPFTPSLSKLLKQNNFQLIIPQFRSMPNYKIHTIYNDVEDLHKIIEMNKDKKIILLGHSTGCQVSLLYLQKYGSSNITSVYLQAPCSDVQYEQSQNENLKQQIQKSKQSKYFQYNNQLWLSQRFLSLYERNNKEDLLSSYLSDQHYLSWKKYNIPIYSIVSEKDQYVVKSNFDKLKLGCKEVYVIKNASHSLQEKDSREQLYKILLKNIYDLIK